MRSNKQSKWTPEQKQSLLMPPAAEGRLAGVNHYGHPPVQTPENTRREASASHGEALAKRQLSSLENNPKSDPADLANASINYLMQQGLTNAKYELGLPRAERVVRRERRRSYATLQYIAGKLKNKKDNQDEVVLEPFKRAKLDDNRVEQMQLGFEPTSVKLLLSGYANPDSESRAVVKLSKSNGDDEPTVIDLGTIVGTHPDTGKLLIENPQYTLWLANQRDGSQTNAEQPAKYLGEQSDQYQSVTYGLNTLMLIRDNTAIDVLGHVASLSQFGGGEAHDVSNLEPRSS